jgi:hypothetical protein
MNIFEIFAFSWVYYRKNHPVLTHTNKKLMIISSTSLERFRNGCGELHWMNFVPLNFVFNGMINIAAVNALVI